MKFSVLGHTCPGAVNLCGGSGFGFRVSGVGFRDGLAGRGGRNLIVSAPLDKVVVHLMWHPIFYGKIASCQIKAGISFLGLAKAVL